MWLVSSVIVYLCVPNLSFLEALIIAACVTPTDPVLSNSLVNGRFAERHVAANLREIIVAESGANDGFGYPFLFLALCILRYSGTDIARQWLVYTVCYEILLGIAYGAVVGFLAQEGLTFALKRYVVVLALTRNTLWQLADDMTNSITLPRFRWQSRKLTTEPGSIRSPTHWLCLRWPCL
jgi:NhaP-type Na+/H+ or K+/H+ antiporter